MIGREEAIEVLRAFVVDGGLSIAFQRAFDDPDMWGIMLVDLARHAARVYARSKPNVTEEEALARDRRACSTAEIDEADRHRQSPSRARNKVS